MTELIWILIQGDDDFALKCLVKLWQMQTSTEKDVMQTLERNLQGFTSGDALFMSHQAELAHREYRLTDIHMDTVRQRLLKYCGQLSTYEDITKDLE